MLEEMAFCSHVRLRLPKKVTQHLW